jgi:hypothetical protein
MVCVPGPAAGKPTTVGGDAFAFSPDLDATSRTYANVAALWATPWKAWWAVTLEALEPSNYRR